MENINSVSIEPFIYENQYVGYGSNCAIWRRLRMTHSDKDYTTFIYFQQNNNDILN